MKKKSRIKMLEKKFGRYKPQPEIIFVYTYLGETVEKKRQQYLDEGGDPNAEIYFIVVREVRTREEVEALKRSRTQIR